MANRFLVAGGNGNWNDTSNWAATSGAASGASFPVAGDAVAFDSNSGNANMTVNVASACASLVCSGTYAGTLTFDAALTLTSTLTFVSGMTIAGTAGGISATGSATYTSAGKTMTGSLTHGSGLITITLGDTWTVTGLCTFGNAGNALTLNSNTMNCAGGLTVGTAGVGGVTGTAIIRISATGTINVTGTASVANNLNLDAGAGTITVTALRYATRTLTYTSGTCTGGVLTISSGTYDTSGMTWGNVTTGGNISFTLASAFNATDINWGGVVGQTITVTGAFDFNTVTMTTPSVTTVTLTVGANINCSGLWTESVAGTLSISATSINAGSCTLSGTKTFTMSCDVNVSGLTTSSDANTLNGLSAGSPNLPFRWNTGGLTTTGSLSGVAIVRFNGTGTWTGAAGTLTNNCIIDTAGTLTISGTCLYSTNTLTYVAGATSGSGSLTFASGTLAGSHDYAGVSLGANGAFTVSAANTWTNFAVSTTGTITFNALQTFTGTVTLPNTNATFGGSSGFTCATLTNTTITATRTYTFQALRTYTVTTDFTTVHAAAQTVRFVFASSSGTDRALFTLAGGATQNVGFVDPTRMDASGGQTIFTYHGVVTDSPNWNATMQFRSLQGIGHAG